MALIVRSDGSASGLPLVLGRTDGLASQEFSFTSLYRCAASLTGHSRRSPSTRNVRNGDRLEWVGGPAVCPCRPDGRDEFPVFFGRRAIRRHSRAPFNGPAAWISLRADHVDLLFVADDPTTPAPSSAEPTGAEAGPTRGHEGFALGPVAAPDAARGTLPELSRPGDPTVSVFPAFPRPAEAPASDVPAVDDYVPDVAEASGGSSVPDEAGSVDEAIEEEETALSRGADLLAAFSPFDPVSLGNALDRVLGQIGDLDSVFSRTWT